MTLETDAQPRTRPVPDVPTGAHHDPRAARRVPSGIPRNERIAGFTDGVFAIAITLLILEVQIPPDIAETGLWVQLPRLLPKLVAHAVSFFVLGIYWIGHHNMFMHIRRHDRILLWLNTLFLMWVASMPLLTGLLIEASQDQAAAVAYAGVLLLAGLNLALIWWYAVRNRRLVDPHIDPRLITFVYRRVLMSPLIYVIAIGVSFFSLVAAKLLFVLAIALNILPGRLDIQHHRHVGSADD
jgi:uncharacterized membrane protein